MYLEMNDHCLASSVRSISDFGDFFFLAPGIWTPILKTFHVLVPKIHELGVNSKLSWNQSVILFYCYGCLTYLISLSPSFWIT